MTLSSGDVFLLRDFGTTGVDPHYRIVIHKTASNNLVLVYPSTQIDKVKRHCFRDAGLALSSAPPDQYVEIPLRSCLALPKPCAIDCNKAYMKTESECINGFDFKPRTGKLDPALIAKIRYGIENSDVVSDFIKLAFNQ